MKFSTKLLALTAVVALNGCAPKGSCGSSAGDILPHKCGQKGFVKTGEMVQTNPSMTLAQKAETVNKGQYKLAYKNLKKKEVGLLDDIPIGAIIPHWGAWEFSDRWQICMGQVIDDIESPMHGEKVPDLTGITIKDHKPTYIAGTLEEQYFNKTFGQNYLSKEAAHVHQAEIGANKSIVHPDKNTVQSSTPSAGPYHKHKITMEKTGEHDHGGDNKPHSFGLVYLIKVK